MNKIWYVLWLVVLGGFISWACNNPSGTPSNPSSRPYPPGVNTPTPTLYPTVAPTLSPTPAYLSSWPANSPNALAQGSNYFYVAQSGAAVSQVVLYDNSSYTAATTWTGYGATTFLYPAGVAVNSTSGDVYILDAGNPQTKVGAAVYEFTLGSSPTTVASWNEYGSKSFNWPTGIALDSSGNVYVSDMYNHQVEEFTSAGVTMGTWNDSGNCSFLPAAIAIDPSNVIYVVDAGNGLLWELSAINGTATSWPILPGSRYVPDYGLTVDANNVYLADYYNRLVEIYTHSGVLIGEMNGSNAPTPFSRPGAVILDGSDILVTDYANNNIQIFGPNTY